MNGYSDNMSTQEDVNWLVSKLGDNVVFNEIYNLGHLGFTLAKDMTWFKNDVVKTINEYATNDFE